MGPLLEESVKLKAILALVFFLLVVYWVVSHSFLIVSLASVCVALGVLAVLLLVLVYGRLP